MTYTVSSGTLNSTIPIPTGGGGNTSTTAITDVNDVNLSDHYQ